MKVNSIFLFFLFFTLFNCKKENRYFDKQGNEFIEKGDNTSIIPAEYSKTGNQYKIFLINETDKLINVKNKFSLKAGESKIFNLTDTDSIIFDTGPKIYFGEFGLETEDKKSQIAGIGGKYWDVYKVPKDVEYGFVIVPINQGDIATE